MDFKYQSIILNKKDIAEVDRLYILYTLEAGKLAVLGKGVRKQGAKLAGSLEPVTFSEVLVSRGRGRGNITGVIPVNFFRNIKNDLDILQQVFYAFGVLGKLITEEERDEKIFYLLLNYLETLDGIAEKNKSLSEVVGLGFIFKLLDELGYKFQVKRCVGCGNKLQKENNCFSASRGGILCGHCSRIESQKIKIEVATIKLLRIFLTNKIENLVKIRVLPREIINLRSVSREALRWVGGIV